MPTKKKTLLCTEIEVIWIGSFCLSVASRLLENWSRFVRQSVQFTELTGAEAQRARHTCRALFMCLRNTREYLLIFPPYFRLNRAPAFSKFTRHHEFPIISPLSLPRQGTSLQLFDAILGASALPGLSTFDLVSINDLILQWSHARLPYACPHH